MDEELDRVPTVECSGVGQTDECIGLSTPLLAGPSSMWGQCAPSCEGGPRGGRWGPGAERVVPSPTSIPHPREAGGESTFWVKSVTSGGPLESLDDVLGEPGGEIGMSHPKAVASAVGEETTLGGEGAPRGGREGSSPSEGVGEACPSPVIIDLVLGLVLVLILLPTITTIIITTMIYDLLVVSGMGKTI
jgi:hypothetical protein